MIRKLLEFNGLASHVEQFHPRTRDRDDIAVMRDADSGVIFLDRSDYITPEYYTCQTPNETTQMIIDDSRRVTQFKLMITEKDVLDFGSGYGGFVTNSAELCNSIVSVEPGMPAPADYFTLHEAVANSYPFDVITMFHVLEHLTDPIGTLTELYDALVPGGKLIVEVPHARDALLDLPNFREASLWSEHLILHTRQSLKLFLKAAGFNIIGVGGYQRYDYINHLKWGMDMIESPEMYREQLFDADKTDTLIAIATK